MHLIASAKGGGEGRKGRIGCSIVVGGEERGRGAGSKSQVQLVAGGWLSL